MGQLVKQIIDDLAKPFLEDLKELPLWIKWTVIVITCAATIPLALIFRARTSFSDKPRIHFIQNMDNQPKYVSQEANALFLDGRAMRPRVEGTIPRNGMVNDTHLYMGVVDDAWATEYPSALTVDHAFLVRGQGRFNIYCSPCHGVGGFGDGLVHHRANQLVETGVNGTTWVAPKNLHEDVIKEQQVGELFNTITNGVRTMSAYASQITTQDRWAIVAYIKALQLSQDADPASVANADAIPRKSANEGSSE
ncbi:MAG: cytochrome c [Phycisphaerae bacterium]|mgnify:CR=1 FL=1|jgi:mono/diheme cytochrome c family protein|nr:cytochrome c [Phycisphaerae bacterium]MBT5365844.1 cytochrome c [Phycisphaerae bacterium]MBT6270070.1 cytochrome c [Phycisphaerae bacterium]MBT6283370.1 cytochrome c [Phycisphaerae bacterium]